METELDIFIRSCLEILAGDSMNAGEHFTSVLPSLHGTKIN